MTASTTIAATEAERAERRPLAEDIASVNVPPQGHATCWGAILAGAGAIASLSLLLMLLGTGLGLSSISPWAHEGASATTLGISAIAWYAFTQLASSSFGGYLAGRLRTRWIGTPVDEVHFRDTAHGFLAWAVAFVVSMGFLASASMTVLHSGMQAGATATAGAATAVSAGVAAKADGASSMDSTNATTAYFLDTLFRREPTLGASPAAGPGAGPASGGFGVAPGASGMASAPSGTGMGGTGMGGMGMTGRGSDADQSGSATGTEVGRIFVNALRTGTLSPEDTRYAGQIVAQRTGLSQPEAEKRVTDTFTRLKARLHDAEVAARDAADKARKAAAHFAIWGFISLLLGAFAASMSATWGGRQRDA